MRTKEVRKQAAEALKGRCWEGAGVIGLCVMLWLLGLLGELGGTALLLRLGMLQSPLRQLLPLMRAVMGGLLLIPPIIGALWWFVQTANGEENPPGTVWRICTSGALQVRGGRLLAVLWGIALVSWLPVVTCGWGTVRLLQQALNDPQAPWLLACAAQLLVLGIAALVWRWWLLLGLLPAALLFIERPLRPTSWLLRYALSLMRGRRGLLLSLLLREVLRPRLFLLTRLGVTTAIFLKNAAFADRI